ncbi:hypothetical protein FPANT_6203 [Fusarium pseudoanthophilum]|uniref:BTB domain-containing protein n=1 Tax=Fusarium pseudoanthophilum TaxID=48495 RepID=A0A8H5P6E6_9HYPO|nr:hypothetical protein FPANT_6203 [Fusarium pseudoanthophilum]
MSQNLPAHFITSPYADTFAKVLLKGNSITWVHRGVIPGHVLSSETTEELGSKKPSPILDMQNIGNDTAHVIIHFFYTKQYNCIKPWGIYGDTAKGYELKVSHSVIEAARKMKLPALADLAKRQYMRVCREMDFFNLVAISGKMYIDTKNFPELEQHISLHLEKVLSDPYSEVASDFLSQTTSNSITDILVRKLLMNARDKLVSETKAKAEPGNGTQDIPTRTKPPSQNAVTAEPEPSPFTWQRRTQQPQEEVPKNPQPDDKGKGRAVSKPETYVWKLREQTIPHHESRAANGKEGAQSGPSRVRGWPCPFSPPCGGCADAEKKANPPTPELTGCIASMKDFVAVEKSSAVDWEVPKSETEKSEKSESERTESTVVDSDDEGVLVESEARTTTTPRTDDSRNTYPMNNTYGLNFVHASNLKSYEIPFTTPALHVMWRVSRSIVKARHIQNSQFADMPSDQVASLDFTPTCKGNFKVMDRGDMKFPETSQYTGDVCHILFRSQGPLLIPRTILKKCPKLAVRLDKKHIFSKPLETVDIEEYPFSVGHIIIHYLITDKYQCLKPEGETEDERNCSELATAFEAHAAAVDLDLPCLQLLASSEMRRLEGKLSLVLVTRTLNDTELPLNLYPTIAANFVSCVIRLSASPSKESKEEMMNQLGVPENVAMVLVQCFLRFKGIIFSQDHASKNGLGVEKDLETSQLAQEERELLTILQTFDKENSQIYQSASERDVNEKMARESFAKTILETWEACGGSLSSLQHARLQDLQNVSAKLAEDLDTCRKDLTASRELSQQLAIEGKAILERLALELEIRSILEHQTRQNGFLSLSDRVRLRSARSRSNDLSAAASFHTLDAKGPGPISQDQEEEDRFDDDGTQTPTCTSCNERDRQSSNVKGAKDRLEEVCARLQDLASETTSTSGQATPSSASSSESELDEGYD